MIDVGMGHKDILDLPWLHRKSHIFEIIDTLLHAIVHQQVMTGHAQIMAASRYFMIGTDKFYFQINLRF